MLNNSSVTPSSAKGKVSDSSEEILLRCIKLSFCSPHLVFPSERQCGNPFLQYIVTFVVIYSVGANYLYTLYPIPCCSQRAWIKSRIATFQLRNPFTSCEGIEKEIKGTLTNHAAHWDWIVSEYLLVKLCGVGTDFCFKVYSNCYL